VQNSSTVPIIVFGITLSQCENIRQPCGSRRVKLKVAPDRRINVGRVEPRDRERGFSYRWTFSFGGDSSDARAMAVLREHGMEVDPSGGSAWPIAVPLASPIGPHALAAIQAGLGKHPRLDAGAGSRHRADGVVRRSRADGEVREGSEDREDAMETGEAGSPFGRVRLPEVLRDSVIKSDEVLVRFVADTNSTVIPESVSVLDSPSGTPSVPVCMAVMSGTFEPAKDRAGSVVPSRVQTAVHVNRF
jgi:hypothetical protein